MGIKVLYIMSSYSLYGGTPKKTLDLMNSFGSNSALYVYTTKNKEFKKKFEETGGEVYEGDYGRNLYKHIRALLRIIDQNEINIVQTQFMMGEVLGYLIKLFRPNIKLVIAFVGAVKRPKIKSALSSYIYNKADKLIYISQYVKKEIEKEYNNIVKNRGIIIYNGVPPRLDNGIPTYNFKKYSLLSVSSLLKLKNIQVVIKAMNILINEKGINNIHYYIAGEGGANYKPQLIKMINNYKLGDYVFLMGDQQNIGRLLNSADLFLHPSYNEGFGIAVVEAMHSGKPIIASKAGALPELIDHEVNGLLIDPHDPCKWAESITSLLNKPKYAKNLGEKAVSKAHAKFSVDYFATNYKKLYKILHEDKI